MCPLDLPCRGSGVPISGCKADKKGYHRTSKAADVLFPARNHETNVSWTKPTDVVQGSPGSASTGLRALFTAPQSRCSYPPVNSLLYITYLSKSCEGILQWWTLDRRWEHRVPGVPFNILVYTKLSLLGLHWEGLLCKSSLLLFGLTKIVFSFNIYAQCPLLFCIKIISI